MATATKTKATKSGKAKAKGGEFDSLTEVKERLSGCILSFRWWGTTKSVSREDQVAAAQALEADDKEVRTSRYLIDRKMEEWADLGRIKGACQNFYNYRTLPYVIDGQRLFRREDREAIWDGVNSYRTQIEEAAKRLEAKRSQVIKWAKERLGRTFDESLYPLDWSKKFAVELREFSIDPPSYLRTRDEAEYRKELDRTLRDIGHSMERFQSDCARQIGHSVTTLATAMTTGQGVQGATLENARATFQKIAQFRFDGTAAFKRSMREAEELLDGVDLEAIRRSHAARVETKDKLEALMKRHKELLQIVSDKAK